jgi:hypothetical protein
VAPRLDARHADFEVGVVRREDGHHVALRVRFKVVGCQAQVNGMLGSG